MVFNYRSGSERFLRREVAIDALAPKLGAVKFDYLGMLLDALKRSPLVTIGLRRRGTTLAILECMFAIMKRARQSFLGKTLSTLRWPVRESA